jgi:hypothetical protein
MESVFVELIAPVGTTEVAQLQLRKPGTDEPLDPNWRVISENGLPVIYAGDKRLTTRPVSAEERDGIGGVMTVRVEVS